MACVTPDRPPMMNIVTNPIENSIGVFNRIDPPHIVAVQLNIFTPVGTAMNMVETANAELATGPRPVANMWCAQTPQPINPMAMPENTTTGYPNSGLRENVGSTSDTMPIAGRMRMYTSGWPNNQNRCCHSKGSPPLVALKKFVPIIRSNTSWMSPTVSTGSANTRRN